MTTDETWPLFLLPFSLLSVVKADCPVPVLNGKFILSTESIQMNTFPEGSKAFVECPKGQERKEGSNVITCTNGIWSTVELICKKIDCGSPENSPHMNYNIPSGTLFGSLIQPECDRGYDLEGSSYRQCLVSGWSGRSECILITCDEPAPIEHGKFITPGRIPQLDDVIEYSCEENYTLSGNRSIKCGANWEYDLPPPECKEIECQVPEIRFGNQTEGNPPYSYKSKATFECWPGYRMKGFATSVCEESGWSALPVCVQDIITQTTTITTTNLTTTTATATTHAHGTHEEQPDSELLSSGPVIALCIIVGCVIIVLVLCREYKQRGSYNTGEGKKTIEELLLKQSP
ncbi:sushi, von Willebrand factor type A, EGF and pentraxin domain-containing protein 1 isoform X2 [Pimephales promelas]|uniref:sushi, von Willebrand factor type A, EGF and pentraxin domain-containing protein 1 isoform X2 n=1 Tax=Pimephales promelas TaxID=90988 RepID=UPI001955DFCA|nr:sushi, von Willebrand factor type A, EGF and pentraxin domain-containing protein 1 isoform X2 [Pimephales promelas]KAG1963095.1 sushi, von Willebrand factor type A, EGF and pentraxin domain-containing protein [Pimephales promelas]